MRRDTSTSFRSLIAGTALLLLISGCSSSDTDPATTTSAATVKSSTRPPKDSTTTVFDDESTSEAGTTRRFPGGVPFGLPDPCVIATDDELANIFRTEIGNARAGRTDASMVGSVGSVTCRWNDNDETVTLDVTVANNQTYSDAVGKLTQSTPILFAAGVDATIDNQTGDTYLELDGLLWIVSVDNQEFSKASAAVAGLIVE